MPWPRIAPLALAACCAGPVTAQAARDSLSLPVRLQLLSTCRVSAAPAATAEPGVAALLIRCSRRTPFAALLASGTRPRFAGTGSGLGATGPVWSFAHSGAADASVQAENHDERPTLSIDY